MKKKNLILMVMGLATALPAFAEPGEKLVMHESYTLDLNLGNLAKCIPGLAPNDHNFPTPTVVSFRLVPFNFWGRAYFNSELFTHQTKTLGDFCPRFESITKSFEMVPALVEREVSEYIHFSSLQGKEKCMKSYLERMTVQIKGVPFEGRTIFDVGPVDEALCRQ